MNNAPYEIRQCTRSECCFRFPAPSGNRRAQHCPLCGSSTDLVATPAGQHSGPAAHVPETPAAAHVPPGHMPDAILLDNIRSTYNVGSILRTADGAGVRYLHLCGITPTPDNPKVAKTALGAEQSVRWAHHRNGVTAARMLRAQGSQLWALEIAPCAVSLFDAVADLPPVPLVLVVGNERIGVDPGILALCEQVVALPMAGVKHSLNVATAFGIAVYTLRYGMQPKRD